MTKLSELVGKLEKLAGQKTKRFRDRTKGKWGGYIGIGLLCMYVYGMFINVIRCGMASFGTSGEETVRVRWEFNPFANWLALFTPTGFAVTAIIAIFIILFTKKGYHWLSGYRFEKDKRGFDILPDGTHGTSGWLKFKDVAAKLKRLDDSHPVKVPFTVFNQAGENLWGNSRR